MIKDWNFSMKNVYTCTCRSSADGCPRVSPKIPFYKLIAIYFKHLWYTDICYCVSPNLFMNKQEMNRSFAFAFADHRQQVLDIRIRLALQCIDFPITSFLMIEPTQSIKLSLKLFNQTLYLLSQNNHHGGFSPTESSQKFRRHSDQDYFPYKRFLPEIKFPRPSFRIFPHSFVADSSRWLCKCIFCVFDCSDFVAQNMQITLQRC